MFRWLYRRVSAKLLRIAPDDPAIDTSGMTEREALKRLLELARPEATLRVLVTSDSNWKEKWETPSNIAPNFNEAKAVSRGKQVFVLTFFANPKLSDDGKADVTCDIDVTRPNGTPSVHQADAVCFKGALKEPRQTYLSAPVIGFSGDPGDPAGEWLVRVTLKDNIRHVSVPLKTAFVLLDK